MKVTKPDTMAVVRRTQRLKGQNRLCVGLVAFFAFDAKGVQALQPEAQLWQQLPQQPGAPAALDDGWAKPAGEFMVYAEACAPAGRPAVHVDVTARVGSLARTLCVHGDRHWTLLGLRSAAQPFVRLPIAPHTAFGGAASPVNPVGLGLPPTDDAPHRLPNVEVLRAPLVFPTDRPEPAGFWGLDGAAPQRLALLGATGEAWARSTWPHLPDDTSAAYFHSAPPAQRLSDGFFKGDESFELVNLHPTRPLIQGHLPGLRARCVAVMGRAGEAECVVDLPTQAETVWLMPGIACGAVLYRAVLPVQDEEALDVHELIAQWEDLADQPTPAEALRAAAAPPAAPGVPMAEPASAAAVDAAAGAIPSPAAALAVPGMQAMAQERSAFEAQLPASDPDLARIQGLADQMNADTDRLLADNGLSRADIEPMLRPAPVPAKEWSLDDIEKLAADMNADTDRLLAENGLTRADVAPPVPAPLPPSSQVDVEAFTQQMNAERRALLDANGLTDADVAAFVREHTGNEELAHSLEAPIAFPAPVEAPSALPAASGMALPGELSAVDALAPPEAASDAARAPVLPPVTPPPQAQALTREDVIAMHARGEGFVARDLSGLDLSDLDLSGADLREAVLEGTVFKASQLAGARFDGALLQQADFSGAALQGASLAVVKAHGANFAAARLDQAVLSGADMTGADFSAASLVQSQATRTDFSGSRMAGLQAAGLQAPSANFGGCALARSDLSGAQLQAARFEQADVSGAQLVAIQGALSDWHAAKAEGVDFSGADLRNSRAGANASFADAQFTGAHLDQAAWGGVDLQRARLDQATLTGVDWTAVQAHGLQMRGADARGARFDRAELAQADVRGSNLMGASLHRAQLDGTLLDLSNLHGADLYGSTIGRAHSRQAITTSTLLALAGRPETRS